MSDRYFINNEDLTSVANAIREKTNTTEKLEFPTKFISEIKKITGGEEYKGSYQVTPKVNEQVLETKEKVMKDNLTVVAIPFFETSNEVGGNTVYIAKEI